MKNRFSGIFRQKEAGFTLIEVLVAIVLVSIIAIGASAGIYHLLGINSTNANTVTITTNIESASNYLMKDVLVSDIDVAADPVTGIGETDTEWLWLEWAWPDGAGGIENHRVAYQIEGNELYRTHKIYNLSGTISETRTMIAQYIDPDLTGWELIEESGDITVEITISASIDGYKSDSESRTFQVAPRMDHF